ncbi:MAG: cobalt-precorrin-6A reductase [Actinomycetales bacterium]
MRVLILGGTAEARSLAQTLVRAGVEVESSLAGRVSRPRMPVGRVRIGGFGGVDGLVAYLREHRVDVLIDATHPFARTMSAHAAAAAEATSVRLVRLLRPGWSEHPLAPGWQWVDDYDDAVRSAQEHLPDGWSEQSGAPVFITTGRQTLDHYRAWHGRPVLVRVVEPLETTPPGWTVIHDRGPYDVAGETDLMQRHRVHVLTTKDSGGIYTQAKLEAADRLGVRVIVVRRPPVPVAATAVGSVDEVLASLGLLAPQHPS